MTSTHPRHAIVIGGGPAGLMAAEVLANAGVQVDLYDAMPSVGRKFLLAGKGGMNLTHNEPSPAFLSRYASRQSTLQPVIDAFDATALRAWCNGLGIATFVGSSGRVFPADMKAAPLLRAWLHRLRAAGVRFHMRHAWQGWDDSGALVFEHAGERLAARADAVVLALGGASWARLGSNGAWVPWLSQRGIDVADLKPANCGFNVGWSPFFQEKFAGLPLKTIAIRWHDGDGVAHIRIGECVISADGIEGSLIYALSATLRDQIAAHGSVTIELDLAPGKDAERVLAEVAHPRGSRSLASHLQSRVGLAGVKMGLLRELVSKEDIHHPAKLAVAIKALPVTLTSTRPIDEAISSAGGVRFSALDAQLMAAAVPGVFCAGEMLDWEAPTGGYLLTACFATGRHAALGAISWLDQLPLP
ncbi:TIGR03862 family flavoprotein [Actimicrobium antarcticum]|uniref:TIGR03862 family flavoprotein n=1 Tax=Actimicrobium antarcticum TaxID=1051899 RepID=A0ABP7SHE9_9BURK